jgi:hypothetical protein
VGFGTNKYSNADEGRGRDTCEVYEILTIPSRQGQLLLFLLTKAKQGYYVKNRYRQEMEELKHHHTTLTMRNNSPLIVCLVDSSNFRLALTSQLPVCDYGKAEGPLLRVSLSGLLESS